MKSVFLTKKQFAKVQLGAHRRASILGGRQHCRQSDGVATQAHCTAFVKALFSLPRTQLDEEVTASLGLLLRRKSKMKILKSAGFGRDCPPSLFRLAPDDLREWVAVDEPARRGATRGAAATPPT